VAAFLDVGVETALPLEAALTELALDRVHGTVASHVDSQASFALADLAAHLADEFVQLKKCLKLVPCKIPCWSVPVPNKDSFN
jgi:hypothetical protein